MRDRDFDLDELLDEKNEELRSAVGSASMLEMLRRDISEASELNMRVLARLAVLAQMKVDEHRAIRRNIAESGETGARLRYGARVRLRKDSLAITWYKNTNVHKGKVYSKELPKGRGSRYLDRSFADANALEKEFIGTIEDYFAVIRESNESLRKMRSAVAELERRVTKIAEG